jgi:hypothetical protein
MIESDRELISTWWFKHFGWPMWVLPKITVFPCFGLPNKWLFSRLAKYIDLTWKQCGWVNNIHQCHKHHEATCKSCLNMICNSWSSNGQNYREKVLVPQTTIYTESFRLFLQVISSLIIISLIKKMNLIQNSTLLPPQSTPEEDCEHALHILYHIMIHIAYYY